MCIERGKSSLSLPVSATSYNGINVSRSIDLNARGSQITNPCKLMSQLFSWQLMVYLNFKKTRTLVLLNWNKGSLILICAVTIVKQWLLPWLFLLHPVWIMVYLTMWPLTTAGEIFLWQLTASTQASLGLTSGPSGLQARNMQWQYFSNSLFSSMSIPQVSFP